MCEEIKKFIVNYIEKKGNLPKNVDLDNFNYIESGYIDSMGIIKFVVELESKFNVQITDEEMISSSFKTIGGLVSLIEKKL